MQEIIDKAREQFEKQLPFVLFANPNDTMLTAYFQKDAVLTSFEGQDGFVFTSFTKEKSYVFEVSACSLLSGKILDTVNESTQLEKLSNINSDKNNFELLVEKSVAAIVGDQFKKVVVSRKVTLPIRMDFELSFLKLLSTYQTAFRYWLFHPKIGMWMGASPEQLLYIEKDVMKTVALAGTQLHTEVIIWESKEKEEQQFVTDYIVNQITPFVKEMNVSKPFTVKAGNLAHIKTTIQAILKAGDMALDLVNIMHPTSAICGLPKEPSLAFIKANEGYDRKFYSGYLGEWNAFKKNLFVNLRCMEIESETTHLYVGCGITKDSIPEKEFFETQNKLGTMLKVIKVKTKI